MSYHLTYTAPAREAWRNQAACAGRADVFFPAGGESDVQEAAAKRICRKCPVSQQCLDSALADEGKAPVYARVGIRGGLTSIERGRLAGVVQQVEEPGLYDEMDELLRLGTMLDVEVARALGAAVVTVHRRRNYLRLPVVRPRSTPQGAFDAGARHVDGGHVEWQTNAQNPAVALDGRPVLVKRLAFQLGYGREPVGPVLRTCGHDRCIAWEHLTDKAIREARSEAAA
ncbi:WhiB family transcriptional regulator [Streptomyces sp. NPDC127051]|uniref:WhiB family transcriptional regulator n=1 Tax=Streptomyces sp. NPDC127051 TaxID=3347119 RepID=UPI003650950F